MAARTTVMSAWECVCGHRTHGPINAPGPRLDHQVECERWNAHRAGRLNRLLDGLPDQPDRHGWRPMPYPVGPALTARWRAQLHVHLDRLLALEAR